MSQRRGTLAVDRLTLIFIALLTAILLAHARAVRAWPWLLASNALVVALVALLPRAPADTRLMRFLGPGYPLILVGGFYTALGVMNVEVAQVRDAVVQRWEQVLFGSQVSVTWHERMPDVAVSFVLHACYASYYLIVSVVPIWFWLRASRDVYARVVFALALTFYACYLVFGLFPVAGPNYFFAKPEGPLVEVLPARFMYGVLGLGSAYGTAFPSSHVAASWVAVLASWKHRRALALALAPLALGLALGTVYGQFHYAVDALAGAALGLGLFALSEPLRRRLEGRDPRERRSPPSGGRRSGDEAAPPRRDPPSR